MTTGGERRDDTVSETRVSTHGSAPGSRDLARRSLVGGAGLVLAVPAATLLGDTRASAAAPRLRADPFTLGVASGDPDPGGFVIWTRLAPRPLAADGLGGMPSRIYRVAWQVATDARFRNVVRAGSTATGPRAAHSVHVEVDGLRPDREYYYRFRVPGHLSPRGRSRTAPAYDDVRDGQRLDLVTVCCANLPSGYFTAYRRLAQERPDLVIHLGDYLYEGGGGKRDLGRQHRGGELMSLTDYRRRHAQYKTDVDLQRAHAVAPWLAVWDDHEVANNYAGAISGVPQEQQGFLRRRAAAYRAYYEHMPLRAHARPDGPDLTLYRRVRWGGLATLHLLDTRQYRVAQACGGGIGECDEVAEPGRTMLGATQERWIEEGLRAAPARWDLIAQQAFFGRRDTDPGPAAPVVLDAWDGYPAARSHLIESWVGAQVRNPVVLSGDVHSHWAGDLRRDPADPGSALVGSELVATSVTSGGDGYDQADGRHPWFAQNPDLKFWTNLRGYVSATLTPESLTARFRCVPRVSAEGDKAFTRATFVVEDGVPGLQQASSREVPSEVAARVAPAPAPRTVVADTIEQETGEGSRGTAAQ